MKISFLLLFWQRNSKKLVLILKFIIFFFIGEKYFAMDIQNFRLNSIFVKHFFFSQVFIFYKLEESWTICSCLQVALPQDCWLRFLAWWRWWLLLLLLRRNSFSRARRDWYRLCFYIWEIFFDIFNLIKIN